MGSERPAGSTAAVTEASTTRAPTVNAASGRMPVQPRKLGRACLACHI